jgi:putative redox protein
LGGCAAIDLVMILEKMRVKVSKASVAIDARRRDQEPRYYKSINIVYTLGGEGLTREKAERAAKLATEKYCSVNVMLRDKVDITYEVRIELPDRRTAVSEAAGR